MLISDVTEMSWNSKNKARYESLGYNYTKMKDTFLVSVKDLPKYSQAKVKVRCDYCGNVFETTWATYLKGKLHGVVKDCCSNPKCTGAKAHESVCSIYGDKGAHNDESEAKRRATNLKRYGSCNVFGSDKIKQQIIETNLKKYGVPYNQQNSDVRAKTVNTCRDRYGVDNYVELFKGKFIKENSPNWKGGVTTSRVERATHEYSEWRKQVFAKYHYTCSKCGRSGGIELHAHHICNWKDNPDKRYDVDNGITLCAECHYKFHSMYGKSNNNASQIKKFIEIELDEKIC